MYLEGNNCLYARFEALRGWFYEVAKSLVLTLMNEDSELLGLGIDCCMVLLFIVLCFTLVMTGVACC